MQIVITNDDGIEAPGLAALEQAAGGFGELVVVAPAAVQSGVGHQLTTEQPLRADAVGERRYRVDGRPGDCTRLALRYFAPDAAWLLAGVNQGANLGADIYSSGTVAAVREAALLGCRAIAVSQYVARGGAVDWDLTARRVARVLDALMQRELPAGHFWNVNLPHPDSDAVDLPLVFCAVDTRPHEVRYHRDGDLFVYAGDYHSRPRQAGRDVDVCMSGRIAVTQVTLEIAAQ